MTVIPQWKLVWKFYSTHALFLASMIPIALDEAAKYFGQDVPLWAKGLVALFIFVSGMVGRIIVQVPSNQDQNNVDNTGQSS